MIRTCLAVWLAATALCACALNAQLPDLYIQSVQHSPSNPNSAQTVNVSAVVRNQGGPAGGCTARVTGSQSTYKTTIVPALGAGATATINFTDLGPWNSGMVILTIEVDVFNVVAESDETNNQYQHSFSVAQGPPGQPSNPSPSNGAVGVSITPVLSWSAGSGATTRDVYFGTTVPPSMVSSNQTSTSYTPGQLAAGQTYYWRTVEKNAQGSTQGPVWSFTTQIGSLPNLRVTNIHTNSNPATPGSSVVVTVTMDNPTSVAVSSFAVELYHNRASQPGPFDVGNQEYLNLSLGAYQSMTVSFTVAGPSSPTTWTMWAYVDRADDVQESNESDNIQQFQQSWTPSSPQLSLTYFGVHGDTGFIVIEFQLGGVSTAINNPYPQFYMTFRGAAIPASALVIKRPPSVVDGKSYCISWNSRATVSGDESGVLFFQVTIASGVTASAQTTIAVRNSPDSIKHRRSIWLTDSKPSNGSDGRKNVRHTNYNALVDAAYQAQLLAFCNNPSSNALLSTAGTPVTANTFGNPVRFDTLYFTLWYYDASVGDYTYILANPVLRAAMRVFIANANSLGMKVFAAIDQTYDWAQNPFQVRSLDYVLDDIRTFNLAGATRFSGLLLNIEFTTQYPHWLHVSTWQSRVEGLKYGSATAPLRAASLELRLGAAAYWNSTLAPFLECVDSVHCAAYHHDAAKVVDMVRDEIPLLMSAYVSMEIGMEVQPQENTEDEEFTYEGNGGKWQLELNVDGVHEAFGQIGGGSATCGYGIFFLQSYVDLEDSDFRSSANDDEGCAARHGSSLSLWSMLLFALFLGLAKLHWGLHSFRKYDCKLGPRNSATV